MTKFNIAYNIELGTKGGPKMKLFKILSPLWAVSVLCLTSCDQPREEKAETAEVNVAAAKKLELVGEEEFCDKWRVSVAQIMSDGEHTMNMGSRVKKPTERCDPAVFKAGKNTRNIMPEPASTE